MLVWVVTISNKSSLWIFQNASKTVFIELDSSVGNSFGLAISWALQCQLFSFAFFLVLFLSLRRLLVWFIITSLIAFIKILFYSICWARAVNKRRGIWCASPSFLSSEISLSQMFLASALSIGGNIVIYFSSSLPTFEESSPLVTKPITWLRV